MIKNALTLIRMVEIEEPVENEEQLLLKPLEKLSPQQKAILILADVEEKKIREIADILKLPIGTIKSNLHRARDIVKRELMQNG